MQIPLSMRPVGWVAPTILIHPSSSCPFRQVRVQPPRMLQCSPLSAHRALSSFVLTLSIRKRRATIPMSSARLTPPHSCPSNNSKATDMPHLPNDVFIRICLHLSQHNRNKIQLLSRLVTDLVREYCYSSLVITHQDYNST